MLPNLSGCLNADTHQVVASPQQLGQKRRDLVTLLQRSFACRVFHKKLWMSSSERRAEDSELGFEESQAVSSPQIAKQ